MTAPRPSLWVTVSVLVSGLTLMLLSSLNGDRELFTGGVMLTWFTVGYAIGRMLW